MRWVVKVGSSVLADADGTMRRDRVENIAAQVAALRRRGNQVVIVSSGAVASGFRRLGFDRPPTALPERQACASVGQFYLVGAYADVFERHGSPAGLVLLTHEDFSDRSRYLNARNTIEMLLDRGAVPIVNENDAVAVEEILLGDNDQLAAMVAALVRAEILVFLSNVPGVFDPSAPDQQVITRVDQLDALIASVDRAASTLGRGGMRGKLIAAQKAGSFGVRSYIASGQEAGVLEAIADGRAVGTCIAPSKRAMNARRFWLKFATRTRGTLIVDDGAIRALTTGTGSLLPKGIVEVRGDFRVGDPVEIAGGDGTVIARGLSEYSSDELRRIAGHRSEEFSDLLGYRRTDEAVHRNDMVIDPPSTVYKRAH